MLLQSMLAALRRSEDDTTDRGDRYCRGSGPVAVGDTTVGKVTPWEALDEPRVQAGQPCRGAIGENHGPQAFWLFSSDAGGVQGFSNIRIGHAGRRDPVRTIVLVADNVKLKLGAGAGFLVRPSSAAIAEVRLNRERESERKGQPQEAAPSYDILQDCAVYGR